MLVPTCSSSPPGSFLYDAFERQLVQESAMVFVRGDHVGVICPLSFVLCHLSDPEQRQVICLQDTFHNWTPI